MLRDWLPENLGAGLSRVLVSCGWLVDIYRLNLSLAGVDTLSGRVESVLRATRNVVDRKWVLFRPEVPEYRHVLYKICLLLGYRITEDPTKSFGVAIKWKDATFSGREAVLSRLTTRRVVLNLECQDISKTHADRVFGEIFGYCLTIDPRTHAGPCVQKSNLNAQHDGRVIDCPAVPEPDFVYQRVIDNEVAGGLVQDIRVPVFRDAIPFVYLKYRPRASRFSNANMRVELASVADVLSHEEVGKIIRFCRRMGVDYGELDVLRHREDGRLYIADVNTTPWGPPMQLSREGKQAAVVKLAMAFREAFVERV